MLTILHGLLIIISRTNIDRFSRADRQGLKGTVEIGRLRQAILRALRLELDHRTAGTKNPASVDPQQQLHQQQQQQNQVCDALIQKIPLLRWVTIKILNLNI